MGKTMTGFVLFYYLPSKLQQHWKLTSAIESIELGLFKI